MYETFQVGGRAVTLPVKRPFSHSRHKGDGTTETFNLGFEGVAGRKWLDEDHIFIFQRVTDPSDGAYDQWDLLPPPYDISGEQVTLPSAPPVPDDDMPNIMIRRIVPKEVPWNWQYADSIFSKDNINDAFLYQQYYMHELQDGFMANDIESVLDWGNNPAGTVGIRQIRSWTYIMPAEGNTIPLGVPAKGVVIACQGVSQCGELAYELEGSNVVLAEDVDQGTEVAVTMLW